MLRITARCQMSSRKNDTRLGVNRGETLESSYLDAFCLISDDSRTFRFDRIQAIYKGKEKIKNPLEYFSMLYGDEEDVDTSQLAADALKD